ncbi:MAG: type IV pilin [Thermoplasmatota archaeon]
MKANQTFKHNEEAVSPVIGVILMVAITVVLAAVVFVLVTKLSSNNSTSAPTLSMSTDSVADKLTVSSAGTGADWSRIKVSVGQCTLASNLDAIAVGNGASTTVHQNAVAHVGASAANTATLVSAANCASAVAVQVAATATPITAGDFLNFCFETQSTQATATGATATNAVVTVTDSVANQQLGTWTLTNINKCA